MKNFYYVLLFVTALLSCKKEDDDMPEQQPSNEMVIVATDNLNIGPSVTYAYYAIISDFQGNVLDFAEVAAGTATTLTTGDENVLYFDFHLVTKAMGQFAYTNVGSYHNVTGDTIQLGFGQSGGATISHSKLTVTGLPQFPQEYIFESNDGGVDIASVSNNQINCEIITSDFDPQTMYLCYGLPGEDKYRYYWNKEVAFGSNIMVTHDELPQIPPYHTMTFPNGVTLNNFQVFGIPNEGENRIVLATRYTSGTGDIPVYLPANFATDLSMNIIAANGSDQIQTIIQSDDLPDQYAPPSMTLSVDNDPGVGFNVTGSGFDSYNIGFVGQGGSGSWLVYGPTEPEMSFKFPILPDSIKALIQIEPAGLDAVPFRKNATKDSPSISFQYALPNNETLPFERRDIVTKL